MKINGFVDIIQSSAAKCTMGHTHRHRCAHTYWDVKHNLATVTIPWRKIASSKRRYSKCLSEVTMELGEILDHTELPSVGIHGNQSIFKLRLYVCDEYHIHTHLDSRQSWDELHKM